jgi:hypothetical protein
MAFDLPTCGRLWPVSSVWTLPAGRCGQGFAGHPAPAPAVLRGNTLVTVGLPSHRACSLCRLRNQHGRSRGGPSQHAHWPRGPVAPRRRRHRAGPSRRTRGAGRRGRTWRWPARRLAPGSRVRSQSGRLCGRDDSDLRPGFRDWLPAGAGSMGACRIRIPGYNDMIQAGIVLAQLPDNVVNKLLQAVETEPRTLIGDRS